MRQKTAYPGYAGRAVFQSRPDNIIALYKCCRRSNIHSRKFFLLTLYEYLALMKKYTIAILCGTIAMLLTVGVNAQKVRRIDGSLEGLSGVRKMNIEFDYSHMGVGKFDDEKDYIQKKKSELNAKESGRGTSWERAWIADRKNLFEPQFKELFMKNSGLTVGNFPGEKYTLIFKTTYTEPGFNVYVAKKNARIDGEAWIVETANPSNVIAKYTVMKAPGRKFMGSDYETGQCIEESYATAGKQLGRKIRKDM